MLNDGNGNEVMDVESQTWSSFPRKKGDIGPGSCAFVWKDSFIIVGGINRPTIVQVSTIDIYKNRLLTCCVQESSITSKISYHIDLAAK